MSEVTAKLLCNRKTPDSDKRQTRLEFGPNYADGANKEWSESTPALSLSMKVKTKVADLFEQGKAYLLTLKPDTDETETDDEDAETESA